MYDILKLLCISFMLPLYVTFLIRKRKIGYSKVDMVIDFYPQLFNNNKKTKPMDLLFHVGEFVVGTLSLVDHNTQQPVSALFSNPQNSSSDENVVTVDSNNKLVAIGVGQAVVTIKSDVDYTDSNTGYPVHTTKSVEVNVTVSVAPTPQETDLVVTFSPAQPI